MRIFKFFRWCNAATCKIKYPPDRNAVKMELYAHMEDRYESFIEMGFEQDTAVNKTVEAMGSAEELAVQLAKLYPSFWSYTLLTSRVLLAVFLLLALFNIKTIKYAMRTVNDAVSNPSVINEVGSYDPCSDTSYESNPNFYGVNAAERVDVFQPEYYGTLNGNRMSVKNAAIWNTKLIMFNKTYEECVLHIQVETKSLYFLFDRIGVDLHQYIWAEDSLGNYYYSCAGSYNDMHSYALPTEESYIIGGNQRTGWLTYEYELVLGKYVSDGAQWIDLHYDRDGRDYVLRVHLPGGDEP